MPGYEPTVRIQCSTFVEIKQLFHLQEAMCYLNKTQVSPCDPIKLATHSTLRPKDDLISNCGQNFNKTISFDNILNFIDEENIVTSVDIGCGIFFYTGTPKKSDRSTEDGFIFPVTVENPSAFPAVINIIVLLMSSIPLFSFWTRTIYETWFQQLLCHSTTLMINSMSNQFLELTTHRPRTGSCPIFSSSWTMDSNRKGLPVSFAFFQRTYLPDGRVNETVATAEELSNLWKPGAMDGIPPIVMNCICI